MKNRKPNTYEPGERVEFFDPIANVRLGGTLNEVALNSEGEHGEWSRVEFVVMVDRDSRGDNPAHFASFSTMMYAETPRYWMCGTGSDCTPEESGVFTLVTERTVTLNEGQIALIGLIFGSEYNEMRIGESDEDSPEATITKLQVMAEILKALGIDDGGDILDLADRLREEGA